MKPLCQSLDILQSEEKAYYGIPLPTVLVCAKKLTDIQDVGDLAVCKPLLSAVLDGLNKRFQPCVESTDCLLSAAFHPHFKLSWIPLLPLLGYEDVSRVRIKIQQKMALVVNSKVETDTHSTSCQSASSNDEFFGGALAEKPRQRNSSEKLLDDFLKEKHESQSKEIATLLSSTTLRELLVKYNTAIPSSAAVERLFSLGKNVLKPKRSGLSNEHFEMLVFLK